MAKQPSSGSSMSTISTMRRPRKIEDQKESQQSLKVQQQAYNAYQKQQSTQESILDSQKEMSSISGDISGGISDQTQEMKKQTNIQQDTLASSELQVNLEQQFIEEQKNTQETIAQGFLDTQEWISLVTDEMKSRESRIQLAPPVLPAIVPPQAEVPKEPELEQALADDRKEERGFKDSILQQLGKLNSGISGIAGSLTRIVLQMSLEAIKMAGMLLVGIVAIELLIAIVKNLWEKYGEDIKKAWTDTKKSFNDLWENLKTIWTTLGMDQVLEAMISLVHDLKAGKFLHGIGNYLKRIGGVISDQLSLIGEAIVRAIPGAGNKADAIAANRAQDKINRGAKLTAHERIKLEERDRKGEEPRNNNVLNTKREALVNNLAKEKGIKLQKEGGLFGSQSVWLGAKNVQDAEYKALAEEVELKYPELRPPEKKDVDFLSKGGYELTSAVNALSAAVSRMDKNGITPGDEYAINQAKKRIEAIPEEIRNHAMAAPIMANVQKLDTIIDEAVQKKKDADTKKPKAEPQAPVATKSDSTKAKVSENQELQQMNHTENKSETNNLVNTNVQNVNNNQQVIAPARVSIPGISLS